jgi:hypothetical protein
VDEPFFAENLQLRERTADIVLGRDTVF